MLTHILQALRRHWSPSALRFQRQSRSESRDFDAMHGVDTGGHIKLHDKGFAYIPVPEAEFQAAMQALPQLPGYTFVDYGCGKGKALLLASLLPWQRIVGVEYSADLCAIAGRNLEAWAHPGQRTREFTVVCADAGEYQIPAGPCVLFFYNPFGIDVMRRVAAKVEESVRREPRDVWVVYLRPNCREVWDAAGFGLVRHTEMCAVMRWKG